MRATVEVRGLREMVVVGVLAHERDAAQPLELDLDFDYDAADAARGDDLTLGVDYAAVLDEVRATLAASRDLLLETLAARVGERILASDERILATRVVVRKLRPPVEADVASVGVRVEVTR